MEKQQGKRPKIRFPEFKNAWEQKAIGDVFELNTRPIPKPLGNYKSIGIRSHFKGTFQRLESDPSKNVMDTLFEVKENDLIVNITFAWEGAVAIAHKDDEGGLVSHRFPTYLNDKSKVEINFFRFLFPTSNFKRTLTIISPGSAGRNRVLKKSDFLKIKFFFPSLPEQTRISSFFTVLDKKIAELNQKKTLLDQYKKGVMQKLFSQELRFKDENGKEFPKWEKKKLGEVCEIIMGQSPSSNSYNLDKLGIPLIQGNADIQKRLSNPKNWTTEKTKECTIGDLILSVRAPVGAIAKSIHNACIGRGVCAIRNNSKSKIEFIYQFLLDYETKWGSIEQGSTFTAISGAEIKKIEIQLPCLQEQTNIANFLSAIDEKINRTENQINKTQEYKKGLLQNMFC